MINIDQIRKLKAPKVLVFGNHEGIIQSVLDFDYLAGKKTPSILGVVGSNQKFLRYFWGNTEILLPGFLSVDEVEPKIKRKTHLFAVAQSGRRAVSVSIEALNKLPNSLGGMIFAEGVPERHSIELKKVANARGKFILGPASVGLVVGGISKLGAIGGTLPEQIINSGILEAGNVAIISTSGGMINELTNMVAQNDYRISFAAAVGGERYAAASPVELVKAALNDKLTEAIVYFGELGGTDEYEIGELYAKTKNKKPLFAYIAGIIAEQFETPPQFGHAKSLAQNVSETTSAKKEILAKSGVRVVDTFGEFERLLKRLPVSTHKPKQNLAQAEKIKKRTPALFINRVSSDDGGKVKILGTPLTEFINNKRLTDIALYMFLGRQVKSKELAEFFDLSVRLLVDHGPQVSGAVNTMITARAGKDITASLASGILTIGPRFGGAINQAAINWFGAIGNSESPAEFIERFAANKEFVPGIGHKKYSLNDPDPRVRILLSKFDKGGVYTEFAKEVEKITTSKKSKLILNVDGTIAALLLDILSSNEGYSPKQIKELLSTDFCNAIFVYARTVGLISHHLEQQRLDEGLFRLPEDQLGNIKLSSS
jgi:succinyl-CoA synthetase alpha subunit